MFQHFSQTNVSVADSTGLMDRFYCNFTGRILSHEILAFKISQIEI